MKQHFAYWAVGVIGGTLTSPWLQPEMPLMFFTMTVAALAAGTAVCVSQGWQQPSLAFLICGLLCGIWWALFNVKTVNTWNIPESHWREPSLVTLRVTELSQLQAFRLRVEGCLMSAPKDWQLPPGRCPSKARLYWYGEGRPTNAHDPPKPGELWQLEIRARPATGMLNDGGYDYQKYLMRHGIRATGSIIKGERLVTVPKWHWQYWRFQVFEAFFTAKNTEQFKMKSLDILLALSLGERQWMQAPRWQALQRTGLAHLMAISGLHLSLVFAGAWWLLRYVMVSSFWLLSKLGPWCTRQTFLLAPIAYVGAWLVALAYASLAGFSVSTVRALLLISLFVLARLTQVTIPAGQLFLYAVLLVFVIDPFAWLDAGFWLSAGAVFAIFLWQWRSPGRHTRKLWRFEFMLLVALAPLSLLFFQGLAWLSPLTNLIVIPIFTFFVLPLLLLSLLPILFGSSLYLPIWQLLDWFVAPLLAGVDKVASWPWVWLSGYHPWPIMYFCSFILWWLWPGKSWHRLLLSATFMLIQFPLFYRPPAHEFALHVLDVGQGAAIVIQRNNKVLLFDAGPAYLGGLDTGASVVMPFLNYHGLQPDWLVLSHNHNDHTGGSKAIQHAFPKLQTMGSNVGDWPCKMGQQWLWQGVRIRILAPMPGPSYGTNNDSCVMMLEYQGQRVLLPGDSEWENELRLKGRYGDGLRADILMVPHHGGKSSSQAVFLERVTPKIAVVSRGFANQFGMPAAEVIERYRRQKIELYDTALAGQVSLVWQQETGWRVNRQRRQGSSGIAARWYHRVPGE